MASLEEQKKMILPFAQRAQEVEKVEPKVAYYCRMYALEQGLEIKKDVRAKEISAVLGALMEKLEKDKKVLQLGTPEEDAVHCENFALTVFSRADRVDRAGRADKSTAMTFYAASYFLDILRHFGDPAPDLQQKQRYAAWRAAEISKAVREGRQPDPPPPQRADTAEETAMLAELAKLEMGGASSAGASSAGVPPASSAGTAATGGTAAAAPPPPAAPAAGRLSGLPPPEDDWAAVAGAPPPIAAAPPPEAASGDGLGGELRLPSPPKARPLEGQRSGTVWTPPPPRRLQTFQKVLFRPDGGPGPVKGTIAKVEEGPEPDHITYLVALPDRIAAVSDGTALAPELATGERVVYHAPSGHSVEATVAEVDLTHWPPSYLIRLADGNYVETTDDRLVQLSVPKPRSEASNLDSLATAGSDAAGSSVAGAPPPPPPPNAPGSDSGFGLYPPPAVGAAPPPPPPAAAAPPQPRPQAPPPAASPPRLRPAVPPAAVAAAPPPPAAPVVPRPVPGFEPSLREITDAAKLTKSATSALQFEDVRTAVKLLTEALALLTQPK